jgi:hypothetical protein
VSARFAGIARPSSDGGLRGEGPWNRPSRFFCRFNPLARSVAAALAMILTRSRGCRPDQEIYPRVRNDSRRTGQCVSVSYAIGGTGFSFPVPPASSGKLVAEFEVVEDVLNIWREAVQIVFEVSQKLLLAAAGFQIAA